MIPTHPHQDFYDSVYAYLASNAWEEDLKKLSEGDAAFVRTIVYFCFTEIQDRRYIQIQLDKITDITVSDSDRNYMFKYMLQMYSNPLTNQVEAIGKG